MSFSGPLSAPPAITHQQNAGITSNEDPLTHPQEYTRRQREHYTHLLYEKWECQMTGHEHVVCVPTADGQHFSLKEHHVEKWIDALCEGTATTADPPHRIFESINGGAVFNRFSGELKVRAVSLAPSRRRLAPRRPVNESSARSIDSTIAATQMTASNNFSLQSRGGSSTNATSGVLGPGYVGGRALKWLGERGLDAISDAISMGRGTSHINRLQRWEKREHPALSPEVREKVYEMLGDALEWSRQCYPVKVNNMSFKIGREVQRWLQACPEIPPTSDSFLWLIHVHICLIPILLTRIARVDPLAGDLAYQTLYSLTKAPLALQGLDNVAIVVRLVARELAYAKCSYQHSWLGVWLLRIIDMSLKVDYLTPEMLKSIQELAVRREEGRRRIRNPKGEDVCRPWEVPLFAQCASKDPLLRNVVLGSHGLPSLIDMLDRTLVDDADPRKLPWEDVALTLRALAFLSEQEWVVENVEPEIIQSLLRVFRISIPERWFCIRFWAADTIRNMVALRPSLVRTLLEQNAEVAFATLSDPQLDLQLSPAPAGTANRSIPAPNSARQQREFGYPLSASPVMVSSPLANAASLPPVESEDESVDSVAEYIPSHTRHSSSSSAGHTIPANVLRTWSNSSEAGRGTMGSSYAVTGQGGPILQGALSSSPPRAGSTATIGVQGSKGAGSSNGLDVREGAGRPFGRRSSSSQFASFPRFTQRMSSPIADGSDVHNTRRVKKSSATDQHSPQHNRRGSMGNYRTRLLDDYKREAMKRAEELAEYVHKWTEWSPDRLPVPRLELATEGVGWLAQFEGMGWTVGEGGVVQENSGST